jgi:hypothetical protein
MIALADCLNEEDGQAHAELEPGGAGVGGTRAVRNTPAEIVTFLGS